MVKSENLLLIQRARRHHERRSIIAPEGSFSYKDLLASSQAAASCFLAGQSDLNEKRVAYLVPAGFRHVAIQWGIWRAGGIAVPLAEFHSLPELKYLIEDSDPSLLVTAPEYKVKLQPLIKDHDQRFLLADSLFNAEAKPLPVIKLSRRAMIIYTSGTAGTPKGVVLTHGNIEAQVKSLTAAWEWTPEDHILNVLPLNHTHGIINILTCALGAGATCEILPQFDAREVWARILQGRLTLFMAVPTIYAKLIAFWREAPPASQKAMSAGASKMRLMVSGSAPLPVSLFRMWQKITGQDLLERYGMTEIGMALSNHLHGKRVPGSVGTPLPGIEFRIADEEGKVAPPGSSGEIQIKGPGVFLEYWRKPEATKEAFRAGWFRTGDIAVFENGSYRILGRSSVDIIKTGGFKVSALEIEEVLRAHPDIEECAVVGIKDPEWGERVGAALVLKQGSSLKIDSLKDWAGDRLAAYKIPTRVQIRDQLPRTPMGKVSKQEVIRLFE